MIFRNFFFVTMAAFFATSLQASQVDVVVDGRSFQCAQGTDVAEISAKIFGENYSCRGGDQTSTAIISRRCECVDNSGPDLMQIGFSVPPYLEKWRTKIDGWDNVTGAWNSCFERARQAPACTDRSNAWVARRCECVNNDGPDLIQIGYDTQSGDSLWRSKVGGWDNTTTSWQSCWKAIQNDSACH